MPCINQRSRCNQDHCPLHLQNPKYMMGTKIKPSWKAEEIDYCAGKMDEIQFTEREIANILGCTHQHISKIERTALLKLKRRLRCMSDHFLLV